MQPYSNSNGRSALVSAAHRQSYDPSEPYRAMMMPPAPPPLNSSDVPPNNLYFSDPNLLQGTVPTTNDPRTTLAKRIPQYFYPRYGDTNDPTVKNPVIPPPPPPPPVNVMERPVPNTIAPYSQPVVLSGDPRAEPYNSDQFYQYAAPYLIPVNVDPATLNPLQPYPDQSKADVLAAHQKDADLSRLEVYHFTPKQNPALSNGLSTSQPVVQYHMYPYPPSQQPPLPPPPSWYNYPPKAPEPFGTMPPYAEMKARGSQTEAPSTKSRGVSPITFHSIAPAYDDEGYPHVHQRGVHTDRYDLRTSRVNPHTYNGGSRSSFSDCRCLDCQRERGKVLNYYPD